MVQYTTMSSYLADSRLRPWCIDMQLVLVCAILDACTHMDVRGFRLRCAQQTLAFSRHNAKHAAKATQSAIDQEHHKTPYQEKIRKAAGETCGVLLIVCPGILLPLLSLQGPAALVRTDLACEEPVLETATTRNRVHSRLGASGRASLLDS
eukprot:1046346-Amphidinium_carterae.1